MSLSTLHHKRDRRTKTQVEQLDQQIIEVLLEDHPQSVRHVFYRMTNPRLPEPVEKSARGYRHVQHRLKELRLAGAIPYSWITDATRRGYFVNTFRGKADFIRRMCGLYRADLWSLCDVYVEVWCESRSIAGVIESTCEDLAVPLYPSGGFASMTLAYQAAENILAEAEDRPVKILYVGDWDTAGVLIDRTIEDKLRLHLKGCVDLDFRRLAITPQQIEEMDLPTKIGKPSRCKAHIENTVEAEAMPAGVLRNLLRGEVEALLPDGALQAAKVAEESERQGFRILARSLEGKSA